MKKLTKDQRYYRNKKKDRTHRILCVTINEAAFERLVEMAEYAKLKNWEMVNRIILKGVPKDTYFSLSSIPTQLFNLRGTPRKIKYKGSEGTKQITCKVTSTAFRKLEIFKELSGFSKARIIQSLIHEYQPVSKKTRQ